MSDALLVLDALVFLAATLFSYLALRFRKFQRAADVSMFLGLSLMILGCVVLVFTLI